MTMMKNGDPNEWEIDAMMAERATANDDAEETDAQLFTRLAQEWAAKRWLWVDPSHIEELCAEAELEEDNPVDFIDAQALHSDLEDPTENWGPLTTEQQSGALDAERRRIEGEWAGRLALAAVAVLRAYFVKSTHRCPAKLGGGWQHLFDTLTTIIKGGS